MPRKFHNQGTAILIGLMVLSACAYASPDPGAPPANSLKVTSGAFQPGGIIPNKYSCDGQEVSPPLAWTGAPAGTKSFALVMDDPDAQPATWVHWVLYDLPAGVHALAEDVPKQGELTNGARNGVNGEPKLGYEGPCPPPGPEHHYHFKIYALDTKLGLKPGASKADVEKAMKGHILGQAELIGLYKRASQ